MPLLPSNSQASGLQRTCCLALLYCAVCICRGHSEDIFDIAWSPDSTRLVTGSVDNTAIIWDRKTGKVLQKLEDHTHFVQGVAWHPSNKMVVTQSSDRTCRVYKQSEGGKKGYTCVPPLAHTCCAWTQRLSPTTHRPTAPPHPRVSLEISGIVVSAVHGAGGALLCSAGRLPTAV